MKKSLLGLSSAALVLSLAACGETDQPQNEIVAENSNATINAEEPLPANVPTEEPVTEAPRPEPAAPQPARAKSAPAKPKPAQEPEPAPDQHAGHDMSNMSH